MLVFFLVSHPSISVTIITLNEEQNLPRALASVAWADDVIVVDSGSTDLTLQIAERSGARVERRTWEGFGQQKNYARSLARNRWVLSLDADEEVPPALAAEIQAAVARAESSGTPNAFRIPRKNRYLGRWILHGGWYPDYSVRLARKDSSAWTTPAVHERLEVRGPVESLREPLHHYNFADISEQVATNLRYSRLGHEELRRKGKRASLIKLVIKPVWKFIETYLLKRGFLDGVAGLIISANAAHSIFLKYAYYYEESAHARPDR
ncbi:MAG: glycosyltransferase family 2 protein [Bdellovibrionales bacterium]|nr:glycosyltransferase family 2 protein [Bdellovibrionales bacterium]